MSRTCQATIPRRPDPQVPIEDVAGAVKDLMAQGKLHDGCHTASGRVARTWDYRQEDRR